MPIKILYATQRPTKASKSYHLIGDTVLKKKARSAKTKIKNKAKELRKDSKKKRYIERGYKYKENT
jgi:transcriptional regulator of NAD metabolism